MHISKSFNFRKGRDNKNKKYVLCFSTFVFLQNISFGQGNMVTQEGTQRNKDNMPANKLA